MTLPREKATQLADLPHEFSGQLAERCAICDQPAFEPRHVAWERAADWNVPASTLPRQLGT